MPITRDGVRTIVRVMRVPNLPDGRRFARLDGVGEVGLLVRDGVTMDEDAAEELQQVMQEGLDSHLYEQHWGGPEEPPQDPHTD